MRPVFQRLRADKCNFHRAGKKYNLNSLVVWYDLVSPLMAANTYFAVVMYLCYALVIFDTILFTVSLAGVRMLNIIYRRRALNQKKNIYIIVGYNEDNKKILRSIAHKNRQNKKEKEYSILLADRIDARNKVDLNLLMLETRASFAACGIPEFFRLLDKYIAENKLWTNKSVNIIINCNNSETDLLFTQELSKFICEKEIRHDILNRNGVDGYVFCEPKDSSTFNFYVENTHGAIQYINKYRLVAMDFISKYPLTMYMDTEIDKTFSCPEKRCGSKLCFARLRQAKQTAIPPLVFNAAVYDD